MKSYHQALLDAEALLFLSPIVTDPNGLLSTLTVLVVNRSNYQLQQVVFTLLRNLGYTDQEIIDLSTAYAPIAAEAAGLFS